LKLKGLVAAEKDFEKGKMTVFLLHSCALRPQHIDFC